MVKWYVIRTATNKEKVCKERIENNIRETDVEKLVEKIIVPYEKVIQLRKGKEVVTTRNHYPGYILIECSSKALGELANVFKPINYVIGFLGKDNPTPLRQHEIDNMLGRMDEIHDKTPTVITSTYINGETVKVTDGPFKDFVGRVIECNEERNKVKVNVLVFGRETPIELDILQISKNF